MFKDSNIFEFSTFLFKTKYNKLYLILLIAIIYSRGENKKNMLKQSFD